MNNLEKVCEYCNEITQDFYELPSYCGGSSCLRCYEICCELGVKLNIPNINLKQSSHLTIEERLSIAEKIRNDAIEYNK